MQVHPGSKQLWWQTQCRRSPLGLLILGMVVLGGGVASAAHVAQAPRRPSQGQAAGQFLRAVLRSNYSTAYGRLAPEVRRGIGLRNFAAAARPLWQSGQQHGTAIELYKLGVRLGDKGSSRLFYSFSFAADSTLKTPSELLEVTFRDTASRAVLGFSLRPNTASRPQKQAAQKPQSK